MKVLPAILAAIVLAPLLAVLGLVVVLGLMVRGVVEWLAAPCGGDHAHQA